MKCECGLTYVPDHPDDEKYHERINAEYLSGPEIPEVCQLSTARQLVSFPFTSLIKHVL